MYWDKEEEIIRMCLSLYAWWQGNDDTIDKTESLETRVVLEEEGEFGPGHVEFEVLATHDHETGYEAGAPGIESLKTEINT